MLLPLISLLFQSVLLIVLFVICISLFGVSTGIREVYVRGLLRLFEWAAKAEREAAGIREDEDEQQDNTTTTNSSSNPSAASSRSPSVPPPPPELLAKRRSTRADQTIIQRRWSVCIENKLAGMVAEHNTHPLAQHAGGTPTRNDINKRRRMSSYGKNLRQLAQFQALHRFAQLQQHQQQPDSNHSSRPASPNCLHPEYAPCSESPEPDTEADACVPPADADDAEYHTVKVLVNDTLEFLSAGIEAIIEDEVTRRFEAAQLLTWNFLSRNRAHSLRIGWRSQCIWVVGLAFRYGMLFPLRLIIFCVSVTLILTLTALIGLIPVERLRSALYQPVMLACMRMAARAFSTSVTFHDTENRPKYGICVANHTSPIDVMILSTDNCYAMVGQRHGGVLGMLQRALGRAEHHIWFERSEAHDRSTVTQILASHVEDSNKLPVLIFPEGTCINNTSVMMFKKGSFEVSSTVWPIAMKYDHRLGDPFWNSNRQGYLAYLLGMMSAWALICDVWYLPEMHRMEDEPAIEFARRCQRSIARRGGLVDLGWDGNLKRAMVPERLKREQRELFFNYLAETTSIGDVGNKTIHPEEEEDTESEGKENTVDGDTIAKEERHTVAKAEN